MRWSFKLFFLCGGLIAAAGVAAEKKDGKGTKGQKAKTEEQKKAAPETAETPPADDGKKKMSFPLVEGHDAKVLVIPYRDSEGNKTMNFTIANARRIEGDRILMTDLKIETFDKDVASEMVIDLPSSVLDLNTRVITTEKKVRIKREDFELDGETMEFNTETKEGKLGGKVRMLIYNLKNETAADAPAKPKEEPKAP